MATNPLLQQQYGSPYLGGGIQLGTPSPYVSMTPTMPNSGLFASSDYALGAPAGTLGSGAAGSDWMTTLFGGDGKAGIAGPLAGLASGLLQGFMGMQNYGLAKDQLAFQKEAFGTNMANQKKMVNSQLEDRQRARIASNAGAYESVDDYMKRNGL